jgi:hypothetical protein
VHGALKTEIFSRPGLFRAILAKWYPTGGTKLLGLSLRVMFATHKLSSASPRNWNIGMIERWKNGFWGIDGMVYWENQVDEAFAN